MTGLHQSKAREHAAPISKVGMLLWCWLLGLKQRILVVHVIPLMSGELQT